MIRPSKFLLLTAAALLIALLAYHDSPADEPKGKAKAEGAAAKAKRDRPLERTRKTVRMLDDIYKGGIVAITQNYVTDEDSIPAGTAFKEVFRTAEKNGWHKVRLVDGLGEPINDENAPIDAFEKKALAALVAGESSWFEQIDEGKKKGKRTLRVATPIPVVFEKCIMCHDNYADVPAGQAIGALTYSIEIE